MIRWRSWTFLGLAIMTEILATSLLKLFYHGIGYGYLIVFSLIGISYFFMALSLKQIPIGIAYGIWEVLGVSAIALIGVFFYDEILSTSQILGLLLAIFGILMIHLSHRNQK